MIELKAPAKINWFLRVLNLRDDGFHEIISLIQKVSIYDILTFKASADLTLKTDQQIPVAKNLVYRTAEMLKKECDVTAGAEVVLTKNIPEAAGLGGGSSDAAATLTGLNELWSLGLSKNELFRFAERIGSDVPFFLAGPLALVEGRGEKITGQPAMKPADILLDKPYIDVSTRWAYEEFSLRHGHAGGSDLTRHGNKADNTQLLIGEISKAQYGSSGHIVNDLESVTVKRFPVIADIKERMMKQGAVLSLMSGSGPTVFGVFNSATEAGQASKLFEDCWVSAVRTIID